MKALDHCHATHGEVRVIDIGGTRSYWNALPDDALTRYNVSVTVVNLPGEPHPADDERFRYVEGDGCDLNWVGDREYDVAHSNSVLEHVGGWQRMNDLAGEIRRVADSYVVQTPYFWFPVEPHFVAPLFHWLPESMRVRIVMKVPLGHSGKAATADEAMRSVQSAHLVDELMFRTLFPDAVVVYEKIAGLRKSLMAIRLEQRSRA